MCEKCAVRGMIHSKDIENANAENGGFTIDEIIPNNEIRVRAKLRYEYSWTEVRGPSRGKCWPRTQGLSATKQASGKLGLPSSRTGHH